jgi:hypothetical protein
MSEETTVPLPQVIPKVAMRGRPKKYLTEEERKQALKQYKINYYSKPYMEKAAELEEMMEEIQQKIIIMSLRMDRIVDKISQLSLNE